MAIEALLWDHPQWAEKFCGTVESMTEDPNPAVRGQIGKANRGCSAETLAYYFGINFPQNFTHGAGVASAIVCQMDIEGDASAVAESLDRSSVRV